MDGVGAAHPPLPSIPRTAAACGAGSAGAPARSGPAAHPVSGGGPGTRPFCGARRYGSNTGTRLYGSNTGNSSGRWPSDAWAAPTRSSGTSPYKVVRGFDGRTAASATAIRSLTDLYEP